MNGLRKVDRLLQFFLKLMLAFRLGNRFHASWQ
jgi:hypothetical protein